MVGGGSQVRGDVERGRGGGGGRGRRHGGPDVPVLFAGPGARLVLAEYARDGERRVRRRGRRLDGRRLASRAAVARGHRGRGRVRRGRHAPVAGGHRRRAAMVGRGAERLVVVVVVAGHVDARRLGHGAAAGCDGRRCGGAAGPRRATMT